MATWVESAVGIYAVLGSIFFLVMAVVGAYSLFLLSDISRQLRSLTARMNSLTEKVQGIAERVDVVSKDIGVRASGLARLVDDSAANAMRVVDYLAPVLIFVGAVARIRGRRRPRR